MKEPLLQLKQLKKSFPVTAGLLRKVVGEIKAVDGVNLEVYPGEVVGLVGESGSGKSTIGRLAIRLIEPTSGEVILSGKNLLGLNQTELKEARRKVQIIFQNPYASLNPRKTVGEAIGEAMRYHGIVTSAEEENDRVVEILKKVGISSEAMERYPHSFSGGQQQRICIGRAIALNPTLLICDEALSALDVSVQAQIINLFMDLKEQMDLSYLFISHDLSVVKHLCDRVVVLYLGKVMESGPAEEVFRNPCHPYTQALLASIPKRHPQDEVVRLPISGEIPSSMHPPSGCPFRTRCPYAQEICKLPPPVQQSSTREGRYRHEYACILKPGFGNRSI